MFGFKKNKSLSKSDLKITVIDLDKLLAEPPEKASWLKRFWWKIEEAFDLVYYGYFVNKRPWIVKTSLKKRAWYDEDRILLYAMMAVFEKFYENEMKDKMDLVYEEWQGINVDGPQEHYDRSKTQFEFLRNESREIHDWWMKYEDRIKEIDNKEVPEVYFEEQDKMYEEEQAILKRIVNIRQQMCS